MDGPGPWVEHGRPLLTAWVLLAAWVLLLAAWVLLAAW